MKKLVLAALVAIPVLFGAGCKNKNSNTDSCLVGKWKTTMNGPGSNTPCDFIVEYKSNGTGTASWADCTNYCNTVGQGTNAYLNYSTFTYTVSGNSITQTIQGQVKVCGTPQGASNTTTTGTFVCSGNTLTSSSSGGGTVVLTRM